MKTGLMILNLGSPDSTAVPDVKRYLTEFLMDGRVIDYPWLFRKILVQGIIIPRRVHNSAEAYQTIWTDRGSPLKVITEDFKNLAKPKLKMPAVVAMRYGNPTPTAALKELERQAGHLHEILVAPMYPHYAMSSYETAVEHAKAAIAGINSNASIKILKPFYSEPGYIASLAASIKPHLEKQNFDAYLFSYHGLPVRHLKKSDPTKKHCYASNDCCEIKSLAWDYCYKHQVKATTKLVTQQLGMEADKVVISFQSRLDDGWLKPYTDDFFQQLPKEGKKRILVMCPAFVADCLETLEEIKVRGREMFIENGGEELEFVPCLNTLPQWVDTFADYCNGYDAQYAHLWTPSHLHSACSLP